MSDTTTANIKAIAPELVAFIDANANGIVDLILADVAGQVTSSIYGAKQERAQRYLAAHLLKLAQLAESGVSGSGPVEMEKVGDVETRYGSSSSALSDGNRYDETPYGRTYMIIRRGCIGSFMTVKP